MAYAIGIPVVVLVLFILMGLRTLYEQDIITKDNVTVQVNAVVFMRVMNPDKAILEVDNYLYNTSQLSQTTPADADGDLHRKRIHGDLPRPGGYVERLTREQVVPCPCPHALEACNEASPEKFHRFSRVRGY
jgi:hypothetical protein